MKLATMLLVACTAGLLGCGALDESAPNRPDPQACTTVEAHLAPLLALADHGSLQHIARLIEHELDPGSHRAMLQLVLDVGGALPDGTLQKLPDLLDAAYTPDLMPLVLAILEPLPGDPLASPPVPPRTAEMTAFSKMARSCLRPDLFVALGGLLREPELAPAADTLIRDALAQAPAFRSVLQQAGADGRAGFVALVRNALVAMAQPGFDGQPLLDALSGLRDPGAPGLVDALYAVLELLVRHGDGSPAPERIAALRQVAGCLLEVDPDGLVMGHAWDVMATPGPPLQTPPETDLARLTELFGVFAHAMDVLAMSEPSRDALGQVLGLVLRPDIATEALPELLVLLRSDAIEGALALVRDLVLQPCR